MTIRVFYFLLSVITSTSAMELRMPVEFEDLELEGENGELISKSMQHTINSVARARSALLYVETIENIVNDIQSRMHESEYWIPHSKEAYENDIRRVLFTVENEISGLSSFFRGISSMCASNDVEAFDCIELHNLREQFFTLTNKIESRKENFVTHLAKIKPLHSISANIYSDSAIVNKIEKIVKNIEIKTVLLQRLKYNSSLQIDNLHSRIAEAQNELFGSSLTCEAALNEVQNLDFDVSHIEKVLLRHTLSSLCSQFKSIKKVNAVQSLSDAYAGVQDANDTISVLKTLKEVDMYHVKIPEGPNITNAFTFQPYPRKKDYTVRLMNIHNEWNQERDHAGKVLDTFYKESDGEPGLLRTQQSPRARFPVKDKDFDSFKTKQLSRGMPVALIIGESLKPIIESNSYKFRGRMKFVEYDSDIMPGVIDAKHSHKNKRGLNGIIIYFNFRKFSYSGKLLSSACESSVYNLSSFLDVYAYSISITGGGKQSDKTHVRKYYPLKTGTRRQPPDINLCDIEDFGRDAIHVENIQSLNILKMQSRPLVLVFSIDHEMDKIARVLAAKYVNRMTFADIKIGTSLASTYFKDVTEAAVIVYTNHVEWDDQSSISEFTLSEYLEFYANPIGDIEIISDPFARELRKFAEVSTIRDNIVAESKDIKTLSRSMMNLSPTSQNIVAPNELSALSAGISTSATGHTESTTEVSSPQDGVSLLGSHVFEEYTNDKSGMSERNHIKSGDLSNGSYFVYKSDLNSPSLRNSDTFPNETFPAERLSESDGGEGLILLEILAAKFLRLSVFLKSNNRNPRVNKGNSDTIDKSSEDIKRVNSVNNGSAVALLDLLRSGIQQKYNECKENRSLVCINHLNMLAKRHDITIRKDIRYIHQEVLRTMSMVKAVNENDVMIRNHMLNYQKLELAESEKRHKAAQISAKHEELEINLGIQQQVIDNLTKEAWKLLRQVLPQIAEVHKAKERADLKDLLICLGILENRLTLVNPGLLSVCNAIDGAIQARVCSSAILMNMSDSFLPAMHAVWTSRRAIDVVHTSDTGFSCTSERESNTSRNILGVQIHIKWPQNYFECLLQGKEVFTYACSIGTLDRRVQLPVIRELDDEILQRLKEDPKYFSKIHGWAAE